MANIIAVTRFSESGSKAFASYINYIDRESAVRKENIVKYNIFDEYMDYMDDETKTVIGEQKGLEKVSALFTSKKDSLTYEEKQELKNLFKEAERNGSNMWQTVISFENSYLEDVGIYDSDGQMLNEKILMKAGRKAISEMLNNEKMENAIWAASFHYNTDNIHIHIATVERKPTREKKMYTKYNIDKDGKKVPVLDGNGDPIVYEGYKGVFKRKSIEILKSTMRSELEDNSEIYKDITDLIRKTIVQDKKGRNLLEDPVFFNGMNKLYSSLRESGVSRKDWNYNQNLLRDFKPEINDLSDLFIKSYHRDDFANFISRIEKEDERQRRFYGDRSKNGYAENILYGKEGLYARLGNAILKEIRDYDKLLQGERNTVRILSDRLTKGKDNEESIKSLEKLSDQGNVFAQNQLGLIFLKGEYAERNIEKARLYFEKSAANGNSFGKYMADNIHSNRRNKAYQMPYSGTGSKYVRRGLRKLRNELNRNYESFINQREAEILEKEIEHRGEEL